MHRLLCLEMRENDWMEMRGKTVWRIVMQARRTEVTCLTSPAASAVSIAEVRAGYKSEGTGLTWSSVTVIFLRCSAEEATSTKEGVIFLFRVTTVTSPLSVLDATDELKELGVPYPRERPRAPSLRLPRRPPELCPPPPRLCFPVPPL